MTNLIEWQYPIIYGKETEVNTDILILGGGLAGCFAAISSAKKGLNVVLVDKSCIIHSGGCASGIDNWNDCPNNPASKITPEEYTKIVIEENGGFDNAIAQYITARDSWDRLLQLEKMGVKIRDSEDEFKGAEFRDEKTKLLFGYDYENRHSLRVWGTRIKPALYNECKQLGVKMYERTMVTSLLTEGGKQGTRVVGATGLNTRTGEFYVFKSKASLLSMNQPKGLVWQFPSEEMRAGVSVPGLTGDGYAMAWRAGAEFAMMERSGRISCNGLSGIGHGPFGSSAASWFPCSITDSKGKEIPWVNADGKPIPTIYERTHPAPGQRVLTGPANKGFLPHLPRLIPDLSERIRKGEFTLPLYADLPGMPEQERRVIFGLMIGQEGRSWLTYRNLTKAGFDPDKDMPQAYDAGPGPLGWRTMKFGGLMHDWDLKTNLDGLYTAGEQTYGGVGCARACATGHYAGDRAAEYAMKANTPVISRAQVDIEKARVYAPINRNDGIGYSEFAKGIATVMQDYCSEVRTEKLMNIALKSLNDIREAEAPTLYARNPHDLRRCIEVMKILTCAEIIIHASLARKASNRWMDFQRLDYPEENPPEWRKWVTIKNEDGKVKVGQLPLDYYGDLKESYEAHNK